MHGHPYLEGSRVDHDLYLDFLDGLECFDLGPLDLIEFCGLDDGESFVLLRGR
jgi:hypothetical protein